MKCDKMIKPPYGVYQSVCFSSQNQICSEVSLVPRKCDLEQQIIDLNESGIHKFRPKKCSFLYKHKRFSSRSPHWLNTN